MAEITVLFATLNGTYTLPRVLDRMEMLIPPGGGWKIVAVDNGSSDGSYELLQSRASRLPMQVLREPRRGKNVALNAGLAFVEGDIVALTDDDIILSKDWLTTLEKIAYCQTEFDIFGGPIFPVWEQPPPPWLLRNVPRSFLGWTDFQEGEIDAGLIWGGNMAVRTQLFKKLRFAEGWEMHSETEFTIRAQKEGHRCWHSHASPAGHIIKPHQLSKEWHLERAYARGRTDRRICRTEMKPPAEYLLRWAPQHVAKLAYRFIRLCTTNNPEERFRAALEYRYCRGFWSND
jgi:glycosyltransferase involved in cell wall biosynthesis